MSFKGIKSLLVILLALVVSTQPWLQTKAQAQVKEQTARSDTSLQLQPNQCVALRKARDCFATIEMHWRSEQPGNYCLISKEPQKVLACWTNASQGKFTYQFAAQQAIVFSLIEQASQQELSNAKVAVSWLYNSANKRRRWRLF